MEEITQNSPMHRVPIVLCPCWWYYIISSILCKHDFEGIFIIWWIASLTRHALYVKYDSRWICLKSGYDYCVCHYNDGMWAPCVSNHRQIMMTSSNGNIFRVTDHLCGEFTGDRWIPRTKASDAELWYFLWSAPWINDCVNNREAGELRHRTHYDVIVMFTVASTERSG